MVLTILNSLTEFYHQQYKYAKLLDWTTADYSLLIPWEIFPFLWWIATKMHTQISYITVLPPCLPTYLYTGLNNNYGNASYYVRLGYLDLHITLHDKNIHYKLGHGRYKWWLATNIRPLPTNYKIKYKQKNKWRWVACSTYM